MLTRVTLYELYAESYAVETCIASYSYDLCVARDLPTLTMCVLYTCIVATRNNKSKSIERMWVPRNIGMRRGIVTSSSSIGAMISQRRRLKTE